jgi:CRP/FNR family cyclic AMP-dependent transcriptional regulator
MNFYEASIIIIQEQNRPLYKEKDSFILSGNLLSLPWNKPACLILNSDIVKNIAASSKAPENNFFGKFKCSGCSGNITLSVLRNKSNDDTEGEKRTIRNIAGILKSFSMFRSLHENQIKNIISFIRIGQFSDNEFILKKGEAVKNLYIVLSGSVEVTGDDGISIATLKKGEVFGEMGILSENPAGATVKSIAGTKVLYFKTRDFRKLMHQYPPLQMYLARLLTERLAKTNIIRSEELASGMNGNLSVTVPAELCQIINLNRKSGALTFKLANNTARIAFRDGNIISARHGEETDRQAFFRILKEKRGIFNFTSALPPEEIDVPVLDNFMNLLLEGVSRLDEENIAG